MSTATCPHGYPRGLGCMACALDATPLPVFRTEADERIAELEAQLEGAHHVIEDLNHQVAALTDHRDKLAITINPSDSNDRDPAPEPKPLEWSDTLLGGDKVDYRAAEKAVAELGEDWRLPTRQELETLLDLSRHDPAIDTEKYPDTRSSRYWTSTPTAWNENAVWCVDFGDGSADYDSRRHSYCCVRAVRSGQ